MFFDATETSGSRHHGQTSLPQVPGKKNVSISPEIHAEKIRLAQAGEEEGCKAGFGQGGQMGLCLRRRQGGRPGSSCLSSSGGRARRLLRHGLAPAAGRNGPCPARRAPRPAAFLQCGRGRVRRGVPVGWEVEGCSSSYRERCRMPTAWSERDHSGRALDDSAHFVPIRITI